MCHIDPDMLAAHLPNVAQVTKAVNAHDLYKSGCGAFTRLARQVSAAHGYYRCRYAGGELRFSGH